MNRQDLAHALRAAAEITGERQFVVVGSTAIFGAFDQRFADERLKLSVEADLIPAHDADGTKADLLDGSIGELSAFHESFGFYIDGVDASTAVLPKGWQDRVVPFAPRDANGVIGWCLHPDDLAASKAIANRVKDREFIEAAIRSRLISPHGIAEAIKKIPAKVPPFLSKMASQREMTLRISADTTGFDGELPAFDATTFGFALTSQKPN